LKLLTKFSEITEEVFEITGELLTCEIIDKKLVGIKNEVVDWTYL